MGENEPAGANDFIVLLSDLLCNPCPVDWPRTCMATNLSLGSRGGRTAPRRPCARKATRPKPAAAPRAAPEREATTFPSAPISIAFARRFCSAASPAGEEGTNASRAKSNSPRAAPARTIIRSFLLSAAARARDCSHCSRRCSSVGSSAAPRAYDSNASLCSPVARRASPRRKWPFGQSGRRRIASSASARARAGSSRRRNANERFEYNAPSFGESEIARV
mmetsp:Transcript_19610/g.59381  ORF Transcript_19610/g.59381 Transcript_19610/m.59381 type:complete len:221 (+) Transcript_19610:542-1204(+)|eukprot:scaffold14825_cov35-Tisochrysis_lutea.AAC.1